MKLYSCLLSIALFCFVTQLAAKEIVISHQGLALTAELELAAGQPLVKGVVLITHGALADRDMETVTSQRALLKERGYNTLAINLSLGVDRRPGGFECTTIHRHRNDDAVAEIGAWIDWLESQGVKRVVLLGHSRGAAQTALYLARRNDARVNAVVLMAPPTSDNAGEGYEKRYGVSLSPVLQQARKLIAAGKGDTVLEHVNVMNCRDVSASANSFVSYLEPSSDLDTPTVLLRVKNPTLVIVAADDEVVVSLDEKMPPLLSANKNIQMKMIDGSGHFFRDLNGEDAADAIDEFLSSVKAITSSVDSIIGQGNNNENKYEYCM